MVKQARSSKNKLKYTHLLMYFFTFLLSTVAFLLLAFVLHLVFTRHGAPVLNRLLSVPFFGRFAQVCAFFMIFADHLDLFPFFQQLSMTLFFVAPACTYLYTAKFIRGETAWRKTDLWHFVPLLFALIHLMPLPHAPAVDWPEVANQILGSGQFSIAVATGLFPQKIYAGGQLLIVLAYFVATWYILFKSDFLRHGSWDVSKTWLLFYLLSGSYFKIMAFLAVMFSYTERAFFTSPLFLLSSGLILLFMIIFVLYQPRILYGYIIVSATGETNVPTETSESDKKSTPLKDKLNGQHQETYLHIIQEWMQQEQPFLNPEFQMKDLAKAVDIPVHHCSLVINHVIGKNFRDWINSYRIQYFIREYPTLAEKMTVESVALQSGFRNIATFYNAFKKETGQMPTAYFTL